jgi:hypothetical protein
MEIKRRLKMNFQGVGKTSGDLMTFGFVKILRLNRQAWFVTSADAQ